MVKFLRNIIPLLLLAVACFPPSFLFSQEVSVVATVDSSSITIGDWMNVRIDVQSPKDAVIYFPGLRDTIGSFDIVKQDSLQRTEEGNNVLLHKKITITSFQEGVKYFPPISIAYRIASDTTVKIAHSNPIAVEVRTIEVDTTQAIKDIKPPLSVPLTWKDFALYAGIILLLAVIGYVIYRRIQKKKALQGEVVEEKPNIPAHVLALNKLFVLEEEQLWQKGEIKLFYSKATEIIREYFELRYGIMALEMTTGEVMEQLQKFKLEQTLTQTILSLLSESDLVKFAKYSPGASDMEHIIPTAKSIVNATRPMESEHLQQSETETTNE